MNEKANQLMIKYGGMVLLVCAIADAYLVVRHWELHRKLFRVERQSVELQQLAMKQQVFQKLLGEFSLQRNKNPRVNEIFQRNFGGAAATQPAARPAAAPAPAPAKPRR